MSQELGDTGRLGSYGWRDALPGPEDPDVKRVRAIVQSRLLGEEPVPTKIDRFVLIETLGQGGMGVVFAAFDPQLDRKVAIKLLRRAQDDAVLRGRIVREAKAMAKLSHPNVAQVYEVGEHERRTFIAMEFVRGPTLRLWCLQERRPWRDVVACYVDAGRGLEAAHAAGLVHRDFKPDNAIVGEDGRVRVLDFGLARGDPTAVSATDLGSGTADTRNTSVAGTLAYMAPEQSAGGDADAKSDQYSFCVSLWEGIHRARPFEGAKADAPAWLRAVLERGLADEPADRFPNMDALLAALADDPSRRRRRVLVLAGLVAGAAALTGAWALDRAAKIRACEDEASTIAETWGPSARDPLHAAVLATGRDYAADTWARLDPHLTEYADEWARAREQNCVATRVDGGRSNELGERTDACLEERRDALASFVEALATSDPLPVDGALPVAHRLPPVAACSDDGWLLQRPKPPPDAEVRDLSLALARSEWQLEAIRKPDVDDAHVLAERASTLGWEPLHARALMNRGAHEAAAGDQQSAHTTLQDAVTVALRSGAEDVALDAAVGKMATSSLRGDTDEGLWWAWLAETLVDRSPEPDPTREVLMLGKIGTLHQYRRSFADGEAFLVRGLAVAEASFGSEHPLVAWVLVRLAVMRGELGKQTESMALLERTLAIQEHALGPHHPELAQTLSAMGSTYLVLEKYAEAIPPFERALAIREASVGPEHRLVADLLNVVASAYSGAGQHERGMAARARALALAERIHGKDSPAVAEILVNRGAVHSDRGEYPEAMVDYQRALAINEKGGDNVRMDLGIVLGNIAELHDLQGEPLRALEIYPRALELLGGVLGEDHPRVASIVEGFARAHEHTGDFAQAATQAERALAICSRADCRPDQRATATASLARARWYDPPQRTSAVELMQEARRLAETIPTSSKPKVLAQIDAWLDAH